MLKYNFNLCLILPQCSVVNESNRYSSLANSAVRLLAIFPVQIMELEKCPFNCVSAGMLEHSETLKYTSDLSPRLQRALQAGSLPPLALQHHYQMNSIEICSLV